MDKHKENTLRVRNMVNSDMEVVAGSEWVAGGLEAFLQAGISARASSPLYLLSFSHFS